MAASKDVFEPHVFASNTFAAGAFRGLGVEIATPFHAGGTLTIGPRFAGKLSAAPRFPGRLDVAPKYGGQVRVNG